MYRALIHTEMLVDNNNKIWKMKMPLKIKIFARYNLRKGVVLTKDNLVKRNWHVSQQCVFCHHNETIKRLFFQCNFSHSIWSVIQMASNLNPPTGVDNMFGNWLLGIDNTYMILIRVGALALIWSLWLCINGLVFNGKNSSPLQAIFLCTSLLASLVGSSSTCGEQRPCYGGVYATGTSGEGYLYPAWMSA
jgi:hypothetical protein